MSILKHCCFSMTVRASVETQAIAGTYILATGNGGVTGMVAQYANNCFVSFGSTYIYSLLICMHNDLNAKQLPTFLTG